MRLYNTLSKTVEEFTPITPGEVKMYACGPTVYNYFHIGNSRVFILFDAFRNYLKYRGYKVTFVQNVTDIDDKIINRAKEENTTWDAVAKKYTDAYLEDIKKLNIELPDVTPKATEEIEKIIEIIKLLESKGIAYKAANGVYYDVSKFEGYGKLSHQDKEQLVQGARVEVDDKKRNALDFALWKLSKPGEPQWESPWGAGRPGWHIECSAMSSKHLGVTFDIHGGGADLVFPHHENEIAQSEGAAGQKFVNYWMHIGYMNIDGEKMSKSKGNFVFIRDILNDYSPEVIRLFILSGHYRGPLDFSRDSIDAIKAGYREISYTLQRLAQIDKPKVKESDKKFICDFTTALDDDFNTPRAIAALYSAVNAAKLAMGRALTVEDSEALAKLENEITEMCRVLKITPHLPVMDGEVKEAVAKLNVLRKEKKYAESDEIKKQLAQKGWLLEFSKAGTFIIKEYK